ncbi:MAG: hypothetical protein PF694_00960 [Bacteroidetes bacterium]|jgi:hypothetical protein|nr:hypothetical protein [Bacteroidota bacterium]
MLNQNHPKPKTTDCSLLILAVLFILLFQAILRMLLLHFTLFCIKDGLITPDFYQISGSVIASFLISMIFIALIYSVLRLINNIKNSYFFLLSLPIAFILSIVLSLGSNQESVKDTIIQQNSYNRSVQNVQYQSSLDGLRSKIYLLSLKKCVESKTKKILANALGRAIRSYFENEACCSPAAQKNYQALLNALIKQQNITDSCKNELLNAINKYDLLKANYKEEIDSYFVITKFSFHKQISIFWSQIKSDNAQRSLLIILFLANSFLLVMMFFCRKKAIKPQNLQH